MGKMSTAFDAADPNNVTEAELSDLRQKFQLLEGDRKTYYEMSMHTMKENKKQIAQYRENIKSLRKKLGGLQRQSRSASRSSSDPSTDKEVDGLEKHVMTLRKNHDSLKAAVDDKRSELRKLRDEAEQLELEARRPNAEDSPLTRKIRMLENRLDKAMIKYNEAQSIRKTYEQIVKRLKEERVGFDNQLAALERTLQAKQHDYEELLLLSGDANHARDVAQQELFKVKSRVTENAVERKKQVDEKRKAVENRSDIVSRLEKREQLRNDILAKANGDLSEEEEKNLKTSLALNHLTQSKMVEDTKNQRAKIDIFEEAFRKIKDATGVSDVNEVIQKIISQEDTQRNLKDLTKENAEKIEQLQAEKHKLLQRVEEIKYSGTGGGHRRKMVDDHEENLAQSMAKLERCRLRYDRLGSLLINVKAGISHLNEKLQAVQQDNKHIVMNDDTVVDVLLSCESTLTILLNRMREADIDTDKPDVKNALLASFNDEDVVASRPFNQRVCLPDFGEDHLRAESRSDDIADVENDSIDMPLDDDGEEELTRDRIKKASHTIIQTHEKKTRRKRKSAVESGIATGSRNVSSSAFSHLGSPSAAAANAANKPRRNRNKTGVKK